MSIDLISSAFDLLVGLGLTLAKDKTQRSEMILKVLNAIGFKQGAPLANDFDGVYAYTLVLYGIDKYGNVKPKPVLELFRQLAACRRERRNGRSRKEICFKMQKIALKVV